MRSLAYGVVAGGIGAVVWAAIAYLTNYEVGWVAWGIGWLVGAAVALGNADGARTPKTAGVIAVLIAALAVVGGKYGSAWAMVPHGEDLVDQWATEFFADGQDEFVMTYLADEVAFEFMTEGRPLTWPADPNLLPNMKAFYPSDVWAEAEGRWSAMTDAERRAFWQQAELRYRAEFTTNVSNVRKEVVRAVFFDSFGPLDLLFIGLAVLTAFRIGAGVNPAPDDESTTTLELNTSEPSANAQTPDDDDRDR